jgi:hypothetical protein
LLFPNPIERVLKKRGTQAVDIPGDDPHCLSFIPVSDRTPAKNLRDYGASLVHPAGEHCEVFDSTAPLVVNFVR